MTDKLKAPFPWFGGKSTVADIIWSRLGNVPNYVEPFAGSLAVLLLRPHEPGIETVNDIDCYLANFWRATSIDPEQVASWADWPVNENDQHARHVWLLGQSDFRQKMNSDPDYYDAKIAGWWVWGQSLWIASGWCESKNYYNSGDTPSRPSYKIPNLGGFGTGVHRSSIQNLTDYFLSLRKRLRRVRVTCGDWSRVMGKSVTYKVLGLTGVLLDPPYDQKSRAVVYANESNCANDVRDWALENGDNPLLRIALCGYDTEHATLADAGWTMYQWETQGGYGNISQSGRGLENAKRETIWFSPHCLPDGSAEQLSLI